MNSQTQFDYHISENSQLYVGEDLLEYTANHTDILEKAYNKANDIYAGRIGLHFRELIAANIHVIIDNISKNKSIVSALITSLLKKIISPEQDIRLHRVEFVGGYSARSLDTAIIAPFFKRYFPRYANKESAFLTLATREAIPWTLEEGIRMKIRSKQLRWVFLHILDEIQNNKSTSEEYLVCIFLRLIELSENETKILETALLNESDIYAVTIAGIVSMLERFFNTPNGSRLPVIAMYTIYQMLMPNVVRYAGETLQPLNVHTSSDKHAFGDVEVYDNGQPYEIIEVKHNIPINLSLISDVFQKSRSTPINRYFILTTHPTNFSTKAEHEQIDVLCAKIKSQYSIDIIPNGILPTIKYYLRLVHNFNDFLNLYTENLVEDARNSTEISIEHIQFWQEIIASSSSAPQ